jgi:hypothetical protein
VTTASGRHDSHNRYRQPNRQTLTFSPERGHEARQHGYLSAALLGHSLGWDSQRTAAPLTA